MQLAGVMTEGRGATDRLLDVVARRLKRNGVRLVGALRAASPDAGSGSCDCDLWLLPNGPRWRITQDLGRGATACRTDAGMRMLRGHWSIPVPPPEAEVLTPDIALAPCLGWDEGCYRLGWGGGYYDRTLAALLPRPFTIGVALAAAQLTTIYPQPHDIPLDRIVTETGVSGERKDPS